jgi:streptogramin lyase
MSSTTYSSVCVTHYGPSTWVDAQLGNIRDPGQRSEWRTRYGRMPVPATRPAYQSLRVDDDGYVWAEHFHSDLADAPTWTVFDPDRGALGTIRTPAGVTILHIGRDALLGRTRGELEVEQVVRYPIRRADAGV